MSKAEDHLIRPDSTGASATRELGRLTGMSRLSVEEHRLGSLAPINLPSGRERFLYALEGSGSIVCNPGGDQIVEEPVLLGPGDFVTLLPGESALLSASEEGLLILIGSAPGEIRSD